MDQFKIQPIIDAATSELVALEVLAREPAPLHDPAAMRDIDLAALRYAALLRRQLAVRVHSNIEYSTILDAWAEVRPYAASGVVLELVERKAALKRARAAIDVLVAISQLPRPEGRSLREQARLTRESGNQPACVGNRSSRPTPGCFLSSGHWKVGIMLAKGKAPKVPAASQEGAGCRHSRGEMGPQGSA